MDSEVSTPSPSCRGRTPFSRLLIRCLWGGNSEPPTYFLTREIFLRFLGVIYGFTFLSLWLQIDGLVGEQGILPVSRTVAAFINAAEKAGMGWQLAVHFPTLFLFNSSDWFLHLICGAGVVSSVLLVIGVAPLPLLATLWVFYLSLANSCGDFLYFQWDSLLLETGFLAIFFAPLRLLPRVNYDRPPSLVALWLLRWLLFRLMFASGVVKLASGDESWWNLTALAVHYETQPLPTWVGWYAHQLPVGLQKASTFVMFVIELGLPFLIFSPRRPRYLAGFAFTGLMFLISITGNYGFFNLLTVALCIPLFEDSFWSRRPREPRPRTRRGPLQLCHRWTVIALAGTIFVFSSWLFVFHTFRVNPLENDSQLLKAFHSSIGPIYRATRPFHIVNSYGLFADMTEKRPEVVIEGSLDGKEWKRYEFKWKPGDLRRRPRFVQPHMPRLDWQMWFAALRFERFLERDLPPNLRSQTIRTIPWFGNFLGRIFSGSEKVLALIEEDPFQAQAPRFLRVTLYDYHFTHSGAEAESGLWWRRDNPRTIATLQNRS